MSDLFEVDNDSFSLQPTTENKDSGFMTTMPVSVVDVGAQGRRPKTVHDKESSRAAYGGFPVEVADLCYQLFLREAVDVFDPFAGWGERHDGAIRHGKRYTGFDLSHVAIEKALADFGVSNNLADSRTALIPSYDGLITCPPYWNLEKYESPNGLDRAKNWGCFLSEYEALWRRVVAAARSGATLCIQVGDWRAAHVYYGLTYETMRILLGAGCTMHDSVTVSRKGVSKIKIMLPQAKRLGYTVRVHETLLVFKAPTATDRCVADNGGKPVE